MVEEEQAEMDALDVEFDGSFEGSFEPDAFYESFQAPKFHDFTAPEEPIDPDAFFKGKPGTFNRDPNAFSVCFFPRHFHYHQSL